jgi:hypothetical protein
MQLSSVGKSLVQDYGAHVNDRPAHSHDETTTW